MNLLGVVFTALTFPGVMVREAAHLFFVRWAKLAIFEVRFLSLTPPYGYVHHEPSRHFASAFAEVLGPFFVNGGLCLLFCSAAYLPIFALQIWDPLAWSFYWLGLSLGVHALPGREELQQLWRLARQGGTLPTLSRLVLAPLMMVSALRPVADRVLGIALGLLAPMAAYKLLG